MIRNTLFILAVAAHLSLFAHAYKAVRNQEAYDKEAVAGVAHDFKDIKQVEPVSNSWHHLVGTDFVDKLKALGEKVKHLAKKPLELFYHFTRRDPAATAHAKRIFDYFTRYDVLDEECLKAKSMNECAEHKKFCFPTFEPGEGGGFH